MNSMYQISFYLFYNIFFLLLWDGFKPLSSPVCTSLPVKFPLFSFLQIYYYKQRTDTVQRGFLREQLKIIELPTGRPAKVSALRFLSRLRCGRVVLCQTNTCLIEHYHESSCARVYLNAKLYRQLGTVSAWSQ